MQPIRNGQNYLKTSIEILFFILEDNSIIHQTKLFP
jgi:hypothetical protein